jgi:hypothetical protein
VVATTAAADCSVAVVVVVVVEMIAIVIIMISYGQRIHTVDRRGRELIVAFQVPVIFLDQRFVEGLSGLFGVNPGETRNRAVVPEAPGFCPPGQHYLLEEALESLCPSDAKEFEKRLRA